MKLHVPIHNNRGSTLVVLLVFVMVSLLVLGGAMRWTSSSARNNSRFSVYEQAQFAAEAATEKVLAKVTLDYKNSGEAYVFNNLPNYRGMVPTSSVASVWGRYQFNNARGDVGRTFLQRLSTVEFVPLESQYSGLSGYASKYRVISNARKIVGPETNVVAAVQQDVQLASIPIFQFAMFHSGILDITGSATLNVYGRVHSNGSLYGGSSADQNFHDDVTAVGTIGKVPYAGYTMSSYNNGDLRFYGQRDTNVAALSLPVGTNNSADAVHAILDPPPNGENLLSPMGQQRYFNKAEFLILVKSTGVVAGVKSSFGTSTNFIPASQVSEFLDTTKTFTDRREYKTIKVTEFDVADFNSWARTNSQVQSALGGGGKVPNIVYIDDQRNLSSSYLSGVRVKDAQTLSSRGLTIATPEPLYTLGHFNAPSPNAGTNTAYTSPSPVRPASLVSDALTVLSSAWNDSKSSDTRVDRRPASSTTVNAAILTGEVYGGANGVNPYSAGIMNLPRLLESWSGDTLTVNGSLVCIFDSTNAVGAFRMPGDYYRAPTRNFSFDNNFRDPAKLPPGTPELRALVRGTWSLPPAETTNYVANH